MYVVRPGTNKYTEILIIMNNNNNGTYNCVASYPIFVVYREWVNLANVSAWHLVLRTSLLYNDSDISFLYLLTNVLIVNRFGQKRLLNALNIKCKI